MRMISRRICLCKVTHESTVKLINLVFLIVVVVEALVVVVIFILMVVVVLAVQLVI